MRKHLLKISALILFALAFAEPARAWIFQDVPDKTVTLRYRVPVAATISTSVVVIDLSDTTNWPHTETGQINISSIRFEFDKTAASTATVKLGVVNEIDASTGSVTWFYSKENTLNVSNTGIESLISPTPTLIRLRVNPNGPQTDGLTPYILSNDKTSGSTTYQTDVGLPSPVNNSTLPGFGDLIMSVVNGASAITINLEIQYHTEKR